MDFKKNEVFSDVLESTHYMPCVSLIMPFEPKMSLKRELNHKLKIAKNTIEDHLKMNFPEDKIDPVLQKFDEAISQLNYYTHKKSIALFVSPVFQKVYYLDMPLEEKLIIDDSFEIRDLIYSKKEIHQYLLVVLSSKWTKIYVANNNQLVRITSNVPDNIEAYKNDIPEKIANFSDENKRKEILLNKFLQHTDNGLNILLQSYKLPLFVMGTAKTVGHFKSITHNAKHIIDYIHGNFEEKTEVELQEIMKPYISDWKKIMQENLLKQVDDAMNQKRLAVGMESVWKAASLKKGRLLIVEKNFVFPAYQSGSPGIIFKQEESSRNAFYIKDAVDDAIEKVLESGGDVEFVDEGMLDTYQHIVLIEYYGGS